MIVKCIVSNIVQLLRGNNPQILDAILQQLSELGGLLVDCFHLLVEICEHLMHLFLLVVLNAFSELIHHINLVLGLFSENEGEN